MYFSASVERVEQGTHMVDRASSTMQEVVQSIQRVTDIVGEISSASQEQNAALVEESASAAASLRQQAEQLVAAVRVFRTGEHQAAAPTAVRSSVPASLPVAPGKSAVVPVAQRSAPARASLPAAPSAGSRAPVARQPAHAGDSTDEWESF